MSKQVDLKSVVLNEDGTLGDNFEALKKATLKKYGLDIKKGNDLQPYNLTSSGIFVIDLANFGGYPDNVGTMIHGVKSSGKSTASLLHIKETQIKYPNKKILYLAIEKGCFNKEWAEDLGVNLDDVIVIDDGFGAEQYITIMEEFIKTNSISLIVVDSTPELLPADEINKDIDKEQRMGSNARMCSLLIKKYSKACVYLSQIENAFKDKKDVKFKAHKPSILFINQRREKMNTTYASAQLPGGNRLIHFPLVIMELKTSESGEEQSYVVKNTHTFNLGGANNRNKANGKLYETGEYDISTSKKHYRGVKGIVDDFSTVVKQSFKFNLSSGAGTSYYCCVFKDRRFKNHGEIEEAIVNDEKAYWLLKATIIAKARLENGMSLVPPDGLLQRCTREEIVEALSNAGYSVE